MKFCSNCGKELLAEAVFCPGCQTMQTAATASDYTITVDFGDRFYAVLPKIKVDLDGVYVGEITDRTHIVFKASVGAHTLTFYKKEHKHCKTVTITSLNRDVFFKVCFNPLWGTMEILEG